VLASAGLFLVGCAQPPQSLPLPSVAESPMVAELSTTVDADVPPWMSTPRQVTDLGPRPGATGPTLPSGSPDVETYIVREGDTASDIADRFDVGLDQLLDENATRLGVYPTIYPGDRIQFGSPLTGADYDCFAGKFTPAPGSVRSKGESCYDR